VISRRNALAVLLAAAGLIAAALLALQDGERAGQARAAPARGAAPMVIMLRRTHAAPRGAAGTATITNRASGPQVKVVARGVEPVSKRRAYEVWVYNTRRNAVSIGATFAPHGRIKGVGPLPENYGDYRYLDVSLEKIDRHRGHDGLSVLRGRIR
jgi:hypothetical protein